MDFLYTCIDCKYVISYELLTNHLISFSLCLCCFLPCVHVSSFPKYQQQYSTLEKNKHDCANMLRLQIVKPLYSVLFSTSRFEAIDTLYELLNLSPRVLLSIMPCYTSILQLPSQSGPRNKAAPNVRMLLNQMLFLNWLTMWLRKIQDKYFIFIGQYHSAPKT